MNICRKIEISSRTAISIALFWLSVDIILLSLFSGWLATTHGSTRKVHLAGVIITSCLTPVCVRCLRIAFKRKVKEDVKLAIDSKDSDIDAEFLDSLSGLPTRFSFKDLDSATNGFSTKLGRGGFGSVYLGTLADGVEVAVKRLEKGSHGQKEFCAEVAIISRVRHVNLVKMKGFCVEGVERLLVYEYMQRGSLDRWIFHDENQVSALPPSLLVLSWELRYHIALETARGLAYLHEECEETILHLDVKPQNILLDDYFHSKVSDFGLSRSMDRDQSRIVTTMRGTPGYLAPEWFSGEGIDAKTDVYSYGMLVLELISSRRTVDQSQDDIQNWFLPAMAFRKLKENQVVDLIDPLLQEKLGEETCQKQAPAIVRVGLWCIQEDASTRPTMSQVVEMLEGKLEVMDPPLSRNFVSARHPGAEALNTSITIIDAERLSQPR